MSKHLFCLSFAVAVSTLACSTGRPAASVDASDTRLSQCEGAYACSFASASSDVELHREGDACALGPLTLHDDGTTSGPAKWRGSEKEIDVCLGPACAVCRRVEKTAASLASSLRWDHVATTKR